MAMIGSSYNEYNEEFEDLTAGERMTRRDEEFSGLYSSSKPNPFIECKDITAGARMARRDRTLNNTDL